jgi:hypothetical protein
VLRPVDGEARSHSSALLGVRRFEKQMELYKVWSEVVMGLFYLRRFGPSVAGPVVISGHNNAAHMVPNAEPASPHSATSIPPTETETSVDGDVHHSVTILARVVACRFLRPRCLRPQAQLQRVHRERE